MKRRSIVISLVLIFTISFLLVACDGNNGNPSANRMNNYVEYSYVEDFAEGMQWPDDRVLPKFSTPAENLDTVNLAFYPTQAEKTMMAGLQGLVNTKKTRVFLIPIYAAEGPTAWPDELELNLNVYQAGDKFGIIDKYKDEIKGVVLYDYRKNMHYLNLATTVAGIKKLLPVTPQLYDQLKDEGIDLPIVEDLTKLDLKGAIEIYQYMYDTYWPQCSSKLIFSLDPSQHNANIRDLAIATGSAVVWLDNRNATEKELQVKFYRDMKPGESIALGGWYDPEGANAAERATIGTGTEEGVTIIPSDWFHNPTVYMGMNSNIQIPEVPNKPKLENKVYITLYMSDGDNLQYVQHVMKNRWNESQRGLVPLNWTTSPALVDIAPGILNYYYKTATKNDCLVSGPSGLGYTLAIDELNDFKVNFTNEDHINSFTKLSNKYLERSGLRVITIWDRLTTNQAEIFAKNLRYIYGNTYQDWGRSNQLAGIEFESPIIDETTIVKGMGFVRNYPCYTPSVSDIFNNLKDTIETKWDGNSPLFLSAQADVWSVTVAEMQGLGMQLKGLMPGKIEVLRADQFFSLYNEANNLPFNLSMSADLKVIAKDGSNADMVMNGTPAGEIWTSDSKGQWLEFNLGGEYEITRYVMRHAGDNDDTLDKSLNTKDFVLEYSMNGSDWKVADQYVGNDANVTDIDIDPVTAKYVRLKIDDPGSDGTTRIAEVEIYGRVSLDQYKI